MFQNTVAIFFALSWVGLAITARHYYEAYKLQLKSSREYGDSLAKLIQESDERKAELTGLASAYQKSAEEREASLNEFCAEHKGRIAELEEQVRGQKEWHDKAMCVVIAERNNWRDLHHELDRNFDSTVAWYEGVFSYLMHHARKNLSKSEVDKMEKIKDHRVSLKKRAADIVSTPLVKNEKGFMVEERKA